MLIVAAVLAAAIAASMGWAIYNAGKGDESLNIQQAADPMLTPVEALRLVADYVRETPGLTRLVATECGIREGALDLVLEQEGQSGSGTPGNTGDEEEGGTLSLLSLLDAVKEFSATVPNLAITFREDSVWLITTTLGCVFTVDDRSERVSGP